MRCFKFSSLLLEKDVQLFLGIRTDPLLVEDPLGSVGSALLLQNFFCVEVLRPSHSIGVMSSAIGLFSCTFTGQT